MEPDEDIWDDFHIFRGDPKLTNNFLFKKFGEGDLQANVKWFWRWIDTLHTSLLNNEDVGISPSAQTGDVLALLKRFFPLPTSPNQPRERPLIFLDPDDTGKLQFVEVTYGDGKKIQIPDGAGALAFIFSVAAPPDALPRDSTAVRRWIIPLLAALSRCLYLAYIFNQINGTDPDPTEEGNIMSVPVMSCAMWFVEAENKLPRYLLGSTYTTGSNIDIKAVASLTRRRLMNIWRRDGLVDPQLSSFAPPRKLPPATASQYFLSPTLQAEAEELLAAAMRSDALSSSLVTTLNTFIKPGTVDPLPSKTPWFTFPKPTVEKATIKANAGLLKTYAETSPQQPPPEIGPLPRQNILNNADPVLEATLRAALSNVLRIVWAARGILDPNDGTTMAALKTAFSEVSASYFVPHYYLLKPDPNNPTRKVLDYTVEIPIATRAAEAKTLFDTLWTPDASRKIINMAYRIYHWVTDQDDELKFAGGGVSRWGRCAETYPVCELLPNVTSERKLLGAPDESLVKGVAMEIRAFSNLVPAAPAVSIFALEQSFTWGTLAEIHRCRDPGLFRLPCQNCQILLPEMDVRVGKDNYDTELYKRQSDLNVV
ncbi:unnamed protein product [Clonostachys chloroleuca]|uniref:Uncharacterized protein n=1 Tax=Clonostachys chloroleuca TaxID=1926264 RepID=A0AA35Q1R9_9HYPO|nr:unnamed protein product [Clonostachys chloroleuca]